MKKLRDKPAKWPSVGPEPLPKSCGVDPNYGLSCRVTVIVKRKRKK